jgi:glyoxylase-like metal-dependent hydrolase (beta-lactamase superfamily II)
MKAPVTTSFITNVRGELMEVRVNQHGKNALATKACFSTERGFEVASVIVTGEQDAVLIDAQWTLANAHRVIAEILETGKNLTTIYVTHAHPDHYFGLGPLKQAFPNARIVALPTVSRTINNQFFGKVEHWEEMIGVNNAPKSGTPIEPLNQEYIELEGKRLEIMPSIMGDLKYNTMVWIPSIKTLCASDVLFNQAHPFTCEVTVEERKEWLEVLDRIETMGVEVIIPGHQKPGMPFDSSSVQFTRDYLIATDEELAKKTDVPGFYYAMVKRFPDANLFISNHMNADVFKGQLEWNWREDK